MNRVTIELGRHHVVVEAESMVDLWERAANWNVIKLRAEAALPPSADATEIMLSHRVVEGTSYYELTTRCDRGVIHFDVKQLKPQNARTGLELYVEYGTTWYVWDREASERINYQREGQAWAWVRESGELEEDDLMRVLKLRRQEMGDWLRETAAPEWPRVIMEIEDWIREQNPNIRPELKETLKKMEKAAEHWRAQISRAIEKIQAGELQLDVALSQADEIQSPPWRGHAKRLIRAAAENGRAAGEEG